MNVVLTEQLKTGQILKEVLSRFVLKMGIEPTRPKSLDFESSASTNSATEAGRQIYEKYILWHHKS